MAVGARLPVSPKRLTKKRKVTASKIVRATKKGERANCLISARKPPWRARSSDFTRQPLPMRERLPSFPHITIRLGQHHVDNTSGTGPPASFLLRALFH